ARGAAEIHSLRGHEAPRRMRAQRSRLRSRIRSRIRCSCSGLRISRRMRPGCSPFPGPARAHPLHEAMALFALRVERPRRLRSPAEAKLRTGLQRVRPSAFVGIDLDDTLVNADQIKDTRSSGDPPIELTRIVPDR